MGEILKIRTLAIRQPWAGLITVGDKKIEYRSWSTTYRGPFLIVGSARKPTQNDWDDISFGDAYIEKLKALPCFTIASIVGIATLDDVTGQKGDFDFHVSNPVALVEPIPHKGKLMLYRTEIVADTPLDHPKYKTVGDFMRQFQK